MRGLQMGGVAFAALVPVNLLQRYLPMVAISQVAAAIFVRLELHRQS
jgi:hypothetical protein